MSEVIGLDKFLGHVRRFPANVKTSEVRAVGAASLVVKTAVLANLHGTTRLSGVGRNGAKVGVRYDVRGAANPTSLVRATGPFHLIERDTKAHDIPNRRGKSRVLRIGNDWVTGPIRHPGTTGKHPWAKGVRQSIPVTRQVFRREFNRSLRSTFGG